MRPSLLGAALLGLVVAACAGPAASSAPTPAASPPAARATTELVADLDVGGRTMHLVCLGPTDTGEPTILLEAGGGLDYASWGQVLSVMQSMHRVCAYDRAGLGMSEPPAEASRTAADQVADLRALLDAGGVSGPFVIGAHSYGATVATLFTEAYPDEIAGLVFVDPQGPRVIADWREALPAPSDGEATSITSWRDELGTFFTDPSLNPERVQLLTSLGAATAALDAPGLLFGDRPVVVLSAEDTNVPYSDLPPELAAAFGGLWAAGQQELADELTAGSLEEVPGVGHNIQDEDPPAVIDALERVLAEVASS